jgi:dimethylargininase
VRIALTREVSPRLMECELTHLAREPIDVGLAAAQHLAYEACLARLGCDVRRLPPEPDMPDSVFVEDTAVVLDEIAVIARPGAPSRLAETTSVAEALRPRRKLARIEPPATLDGGDVLVVGRTVYAGLSKRTDAAAVAQLAKILSPHGYTVIGVPVAGCLHLKSAVGRVGHETLLVNRDWVDPKTFRGLDVLDVDPIERGAAGALLIGESVVYPRRFVRTLERLENSGVNVVPVDLSELAKAEAGVTCCSLVFRA